MLNKYLKRIVIGKRKGVITTVKISRRIPICEFKGEVILEEDLESDDVLQIGPNIYLGPSGTLTDNIRHSCTPNCVLHCSGARAILYSRYVIQPGAELTYDYSTSSTDTPDTWNMKCTCGSYTCRKNISGFYNLPKELQEVYKKEEMAALFIRVPIFTRK